MVANKSDLFDKEQVNEEEAKQYANEKGLNFQVTSALNGIGIEELFNNIGKKLINPNYKKEDEDDEENDKKENNENDNDGRIQLDSKVAKDDTKKNYCCY